MPDTNPPITVSSAYVQISAAPIVSVYNTGAYGVELVSAAAQPSASTRGQPCSFGDPYSLSDLDNPLWAISRRGDTTLVVLD